MFEIQREEVERYFVNEKTWVDAENLHDQTRFTTGNGKMNYYSTQLHKLESLGFPVDGGYASSIAKTCSPSRALFVAWWALRFVDRLMVRGCTYMVAAKFGVALCDGISLQEHHCKTILYAKHMFRSLGLDHLDCHEPVVNVGVFFDRLLPGAIEVFRQLTSYDEKNRDRWNRIALCQVPYSYPYLTVRLRSSDYYTHGWAHYWLERTLAHLAHPTSGAVQWGNLMALSYYLQAVLHRNSEEGKKSEFIRKDAAKKQQVQAVFEAWGVPLDEPGESKFMNVILPSVKAVVDKELKKLPTPTI